MTTGKPTLACRPRRWSTSWFAWGELDAAIDVAAEHLAGLPDSALACPSVAQLCQRAGEPERLARIARDHGDLVTFTAALLQSRLWQADPVIGAARLDLEPDPLGLEPHLASAEAGISRNRLRR